MRLLSSRGRAYQRARRDRVPGGSVINAPNEVTVVRLYCKSPGSQHLRKNAAAELATLLAAGWQEKQRKVAADHLVVRLERPRAAQSGMQGVAGAGGARPRR